MAKKKTEEYKPVQKSTDDQQIIDYIIACRDYSEKRRQKFLDQAEENWGMYNLRQPGGWKHKQRGQSRVFVPKVQTSVELLTSTTVAAITARSTDWFDVEKPAVPDDVFTQDLVKSLILYHLQNADIISHFSNGMKSAALDGLIVAKIGGTVKTIPRFRADKASSLVEDDKKSKKVLKDELKRKILKRWCLAIDLVPFADWFPDPDPNPTKPLFKINEVERDLHELLQVAKDGKGYKTEAIKRLQGSASQSDTRRVKLRQRDESDTGMSFRKKVKVTEFWGTIVDKNTGEVLHENCVAAIADDRELIRPPEPNPRIDGEDPYIWAALIQGPSVFPKALMTAPTKMNKIINEAKSLYVDGMVKEAGNITQTRAGMLEKPSQASGYIQPNTNFIIKDSAPSGVLAIESLSIGRVPTDGLNMLATFEQDYNEASLQNDLRLGQLPPGSTKATSVQIADSSISGIFSTIMQVFEEKYIVPLLEKSWLEILDNMENSAFLDDELVNIIGLRKASMLMQMSPEERIAKGASAGKFRVKGISAFINRLREFQKLTQLLGIMADPEIRAEFQKEYSMTKFLGEIIRYSGVREDTIKLDDEEKSANQNQQRVNQMIEMAVAQANGGGSSPKAPGSSSPAPQNEPNTAALSSTPQPPITEGTVQ